MLRKDEVEDIFKQFEWSELELNGLSNLSGSGPRTSIIDFLIIYAIYLKVHMYWQ